MVNSLLISQQALALTMAMAASIGVANGHTERFQKLMYISTGGKVSKTALTLAEKLDETGHTDAETTELVKQARLQDNIGNYEAAATIWEKLLALSEKAIGLNPLNVVMCLNNLALLYQKQGFYGKAEPLYVRALKIFEKTLGQEHVYIAPILGNLASLYQDQGFYQKAEQLFDRALKVRQNALGLQHPDTATSLNNLAVLLKKRGKFTEAELMLVDSLDITEKALGSNHPYTAICLNNLAALYQIQGMYSKAEPLYIRSLDISEKALGINHPYTSLVLNNLGELYREQGNYARAEPFYQRSLTIREKVLGPSHPDTASSLSNLAALYQMQGMYRKAEPLIIRSLAIQKKVLGINHPDTSLTINNLSELYRTQGKTDKAELTQLKNLGSIEKVLSSKHPQVALIQGNLALIYANKGLYNKANLMLGKSLEASQNSLGAGNPYTILRIINSALNYAEQGKYAKAYDQLSYGLLREEEYLRREAAFLPVANRKALLTRTGDASEVPFTWIESYPKAAELALESRLNRQGILLDLEQRQSLLTRAPGPQRELAEQLQGLTQQLSSISISTDKRQVLQKERERLETELYRQLPSLEIPLVTTRQIASALPEKGILVEFKKYKPFNSQQPFNKRWGSSRYLALILKPDASIATVPLGAAKPIDDAINKALTSTAENLNDAPILWAQVSDLLLKPLKANLNGYSEWFLSPDGELNRVPFAALPSPLDPGQPLAATVQLRLLTTGRDLLLKARSASRASQSSLVMANPNYDRSQENTSQTEPAIKQQRSAAGSTGQWAVLPATALEGSQVATLLSTQLIQGSDATVQRLQQSVGPRIIHVATHGFFPGDQPVDTKTPLSSSMRNQGQFNTVSGEEPMLRSGLVLAGANNPDSNPIDDGYLTALEATGLQLTGTELVVLSACSTGQGEIRSGEGVYGLQRALTVAGARSTLLSLWKVDDAATAVFMTRYYSLLKEGKGRGEALVQVQREFRTDPAYKAKNWDRPYYWAAWQLTGDWKPIQGL